MCVCVKGGGGLQNQVVQLLNAYQTSRKERVLREEVGKDKNRDMTKTPHKTAREGEIKRKREDVVKISPEKGEGVQVREEGACVCVRVKQAEGVWKTLGSKEKRNVGEEMRK